MASHSVSFFNGGKRPWLTLVIGLFLIGFCSAQEDEYSQAEALLKKTLSSISSALDFMETEHNRLNLDAIIGLRLVEGQLLVLLRRLDSPDHHQLSDDILNSIKHVQSYAGEIGDKALPYTERGQADYYRRIGFIIQKGFWEHDYPSRDVDIQKAVTPKVIGEAMHEADSDKCLQELQLDSETHECNVSEKCWTLMTGPGYRYYSLSHEIFYLQIAEATGCFKDDMLEKTADLRDQFCANMFFETQSFSNENYPNDMQDLFMEEAALCGIYGYRQFFEDVWLEKMLSWQRHPRGCWGMSKEDYRRGRSKREERVLPDGCECHRTAVALGALTQYVRYVIEYMQKVSGFDFF